jgi:hypothetical protein
MAISCARRRGSYNGTMYVVGASRMREVARAAVARKSPGEGASPSGVPWCSARWYTANSSPASASASSASRPS